VTHGATKAETLPRRSASACWTCERAADPDSTLWATLESFGPARDAQGYEVTVRASETIVRVPVPRCRACRSWFGWRQGVIVLSVFAGIFTPGVTLVVYAHLTGVALPSDMFEGPADYGRLLIFFACIGASLVAWWYGGLAILSLVVRHRPMRSRTEKNFPPIVALCAGGWTWPKSGGD